jgi:5-methylcytosine-specific restriction endonuclease McrA
MPRNINYSTPFKKMVESTPHPNSKNPEANHIYDYATGDHWGATCKVCGKAVRAERLTKASTKIGRKLICKRCDADRSSQWGQDNAEHISNRLKDRRVANGDHVRNIERAKLKRLRERTPEQVISDRNRLHPDGTKRCRACKNYKPFDDFYSNLNKPSGVGTDCKRCEIDSKSIQLIAKPYWESIELPEQCIYCGGEFEHVDHFIPKVLGGIDDPANLVPACETCNCSKNGTPVEDWYPAYAERNGIKQTLNDILIKLGQ